MTITIIAVFFVENFFSTGTCCLSIKIWELTQQGSITYYISHHQSKFKNLKNKKYLNFSEKITCVRWGSNLRDLLRSIHLKCIALTTQPRPRNDFDCLMCIMRREIELLPSYSTYNIIQGSCHNPHSKFCF